MAWPGVYRRWLRADPKRLGRWGERRAVRYLRRRGYAVIARNWRCKAGEMDVIAADPTGTIAFVEVKTRRDEIWVAAQSAVGPRKRKHLGRVARSFVASYEITDRPLRFDVIAVVLPPTGPVEIPAANRDESVLEGNVGRLLRQQMEVLRVEELPGHEDSVSIGESVLIQKSHEVVKALVRSNRSPDQQIISARFKRPGPFDEGPGGIYRKREKTDPVSEQWMIR